MRLVENPVKNFILQVKTDFYSVYYLISKLGVVNGLKAGLKTKSRLKNNDVFKSLGEPKSVKEELSRLQMMPAIILYEELLKVTSKVKALEILEHIISQGAVFFLSYLIPKITKLQYNSYESAERKEIISSLAEKFPNSTIGSSYSEDETFGFKVSKCLFASYSKQLNYPELAPLFCKGDMHFFNTPNSAFELTRPQTLAEGGECCQFDFKFKD